MSSIFSVEVSLFYFMCTMVFQLKRPVPFSVLALGAFLVLLRDIVAAVNLPDLEGDESDYEVERRLECYFVISENFDLIRAEILL
jgi:hypothetical protein